MCSLENRLVKCSAITKSLDVFSERELFLIKIRSQIDHEIETLCFNHEMRFLTFYSQKENSCCDPCSIHGTKPQKRSLIKVSEHMESKFHIYYSKIVQGNKICTSCKKIVESEVEVYFPMERNPHIIIKDEIDIDEGSSVEGSCMMQNEMDDTNEGMESCNDIEIKQENSDEIVKNCYVWLKEDTSETQIEEKEVSDSLQTNAIHISKNVFPDSPTTPHSSRQKKALKKQLDNPSKPITDVFDAIGFIWTSKLRKLDETQKVLAEDLINQILKKGFFKELTKNTTLHKVSKQK